MANEIAEMLGIGLPWAIWLMAAGWTFLVVTLVWIVGFAHGNHSIMDGYYGWGFAISAWIAWFSAAPRSQTAALLLLMTSLHGCRLGWYLSRRWLGYRKTTGGDQRYA